MLKTYLMIAAAVTVAFAPALAAAQSAVPNPAAPGSGYQIQQAPRMSAQPLAANAADPATPGDGYKIDEAPRTNPNPPAAEPVDGYQIQAQSDAYHADGK